MLEITGRVTKVRELAYTQQGHPVLNFEISTKAPEQQYPARYNITAWGELAEVCGVRLGDTVTVTVAYMKKEVYQNQQGEYRASVKFIANDIQGMESAQGRQPAPRQPRPQQPPQRQDSLDDLLDNTYDDGGWDEEPAPQPRRGQQQAPKQRKRIFGG